MASTSHDELDVDAGNIQYRLVVAGQQYLFSLREANVSVVTRATRVWAAKEFDSDTQLTIGQSNGVWLNADANRALGVSVDKNSQLHNQQRRRRMTFAEQCESLYTVSNYGDFMISLAQLVTILDRMRLSGLIHGDISPVNCLVDTRERHIKISDVEHARRRESQDERSAPLIGVPHFMAIEYQQDTHFFRPTKMKKDSSFVPHRFQFNFLHDLESVIWMYLWLLLNMLPDCLRAHDTIQMRSAIRLCRKQLFDKSFQGSSQRIIFIPDFCSTRPRWNSHHNLMQVLKPLYEKANALALLKGLESVAHLVTCYKEVQCTAPLDSDDGKQTFWASASFKDSYYSKLRDIFMSVHDAVKNADYEAISHVHFQRRAVAGLEPSLPSQPSAETAVHPRENDEYLEASRGKRGAETSLEQENNKKLKTGPVAGPSRPGKRRAEDDLEKENTKKPKRTSASASKKKTGASSSVAKPRASAGKKKQAGSSSLQPAVGPSRRAKRTVVAGSDRVLRSQAAANKNKT